MGFNNKGFNHKYKLACSHSTPSDMLRYLAKDPDVTIRSSVAYNSTTPEDVIRKLATDIQWQVRYYVAMHPNINSNLLITILEYEKSLKDPSDAVIQELYKNDKLPHIAKVIIETLYGEMI